MTKKCNIIISETHFDRTQRVCCGEIEAYETSYSKCGELFASLQKEYGKCISIIYRYTKSGNARKIGWVFEKKVKYSDCDDYFVQEVWIIRHRKMPKTVKIEYV